LGASLGDARISVSGVAKLSRALLVTGFPYVRDSPHDNLREFVAFMRASQGVRRLGSAALDLCFVACGWLDGFWERHIKSWDLVAGAAILLAAGGRVSDPDGGPFVARPAAFWPATAAFIERCWQSCAQWLEVLCAPHGWPRHHDHGHRPVPQRDTFPCDTLPNVESP
jgi:fructose-1,6-bisphosphatase/inositol monophosphatase family enzyme